MLCIPRNRVYYDGDYLHLRFVAAIRTQTSGDRTTEGMKCLRAIHRNPLEPYSGG